mmetsp:Transcript_94094/g.162719  ORF Transcript_94094/g.162719 Transcript_94094/m.162719 type:complete len:235 (-) Transcript_94094:128-832(-)
MQKQRSNQRGKRVAGKRWTYLRSHCQLLVLAILAVANVELIPLNGEGRRPRTISDASALQLGVRARFMANTGDRFERMARNRTYRSPHEGTTVPKTRGRSTDIYMRTGEAPSTRLIHITNIHNAVELNSPINIIGHINDSIRLITNQYDYNTHKTSKPSNLDKVIDESSRSNVRLNWRKAGNRHRLTIRIRIALRDFDFNRVPHMKLVLHIRFEDRLQLQTYPTVPIHNDMLNR